MKYLIISYFIKNDYLVFLTFVLMLKPLRIIHNKREKLKIPFVMLKVSLMLLYFFDVVFLFIFKNKKRGLKYPRQCKIFIFITYDLSRIIL